MQSPDLRPAPAARRRLALGRVHALGNHRVRAAIKAGIDESDVIDILTEISEERRLAIQLSQNAISGKDDPNIPVPTFGMARDCREDRFEIFGTFLAVRFYLMDGSASMDANAFEYVSGSGSPIFSRVASKASSASILTITGRLRRAPCESVIADQATGCLTNQIVRHKRTCTSSHFLNNRILRKLVSRSRHRK
jgi:hypothetical protein